jgi:hypothetical protein
MGMMGKFQELKRNKLVKGFGAEFKKMKKLTPGAASRKLDKVNRKVGKVF